MFAKMSDFSLVASEKNLLSTCQPSGDVMKCALKNRTPSTHIKQFCLIASSTNEPRHGMEMTSWPLLRFLALSREHFFFVLVGHCPRALLQLHPLPSNIISRTSTSNIEKLPLQRKPIKSHSAAGETGKRSAQNIQFYFYRLMAKRTRAVCHFRVDLTCYPPTC